MADYIDALPGPAPRRGLRRLLLFVALPLLVLLLAARTLLADWVDLQWFESLGFEGVFWSTFTLQAGSFALFALLTFALLFGGFTLLRRLQGDALPAIHAVNVGGRYMNLPVGPFLDGAALVVSLLASFLVGLSMLANWPTLALLRSAPAGSGAVDPIFGRSTAFYLFTLPALELICSWLLTVAFVLLAAALLLLVISTSTQGVSDRRFVPDDSPWRGLSVAGAFLLLALAFSAWLSRFGFLTGHHTLFDGVNYTGDHIGIPGTLVLCVTLVLGAAVAGWNAFGTGRGRRLAFALAPAAICYILLGALNWYTTNFIVKPNQLVREEPYIAHNIEWTRRAFGLDRFAQSEFPAETEVNATDPAHNQQTLNNIRLWDWRALQDTLRQVQEIRTYYDFPDIDIDRYTINGAVQEVMLAQRELNVDKLPVSSRNWINERLIYTHGYGITMNPVNGFSSEGLPILMLSNMPVQSTVPGLKVTRPEIYFGELTDTDVYVKTRQKEFDYPQGQSNNLTSYEGTGGIALGGFAHRLLLAADRGDLGTVPFSDDIGDSSRLLMRRNIRERVARLAPFLVFDKDPYIVVRDDGKLTWMIDAFTVSDSYPYSTHYDLGEQPINYMRNSVKVTVDAYNGKVTFYRFDEQDPVLDAYARIFPSLFTAASGMPADLRRHVRYPEALFGMQSEVFGLYHMSDPQVFFNREDLWTVATETRTDSNGQQSKQPMLPNFVLMKLPGGEREEFVEILPFTPANRNNLIGWIAGRCDGANYGDAVVYDFPKTRLIDGPQQIEARIDQNAQLSGQLTLWNQQGSHVLRGSLLVIPSGKALLYAEPIYLQAQQSPMPELRLVVLALQDKLAYGTSFQAALTSLFGGEASSLSATEAPPVPNAGSSATPTVGGKTDTQPSLIAEASRDFDDYQKLTAAGKLGEAGQKLEALKTALARLSAAGK